LLVPALAACSGRGLGLAPTQTPIVIIAGTSPFAEATDTAPPPTATGTLPPTDTPLPPSPTATLAPSDTPGPLPAALGDPLLRAYRVMVSIQVNAALLAATAASAEAGTLETDDTAVAALAMGSLTQSVDESIAGVAPPPELDGPWQTALAAHDAVKAVAGQWLLGGIELADVADALAQPQADLEAALTQADQVVAAAHDVDGGEMTRYRQQITRAIGRLYED
jgi:hypothetical protein